MSLQMTAQGSDNLGNFVVLVPGQCSSCDKSVDVVLKYVSRAGVQKSLRDLGIVPTTPSIILSWTTRQIGVTCGCYAKFHRQIAHISNTRSARKKG